MEHFCLACNTAINSGRSDKKFCSYNCRNNHHNGINKEKYSGIRAVEKPFHKNRGILEKLFSRGLNTVYHETLVILGFNFEKITHNEKSDNGSERFFVYEFILEKIDNSVYRLSSRGNTVTAS